MINGRQKVSYFQIIRPKKSSFWLIWSKKESFMAQKAVFSHKIWPNGHIFMDIHP